MSKMGQKRELLLSWLFYFCCFFFFSGCYPLNHEGKALLKIRERVESDPYGALEGWIEEDGVPNPCSWRGVHCSPNGFVLLLNLRDLCLGGTLAPETANLVHLKSIILRNNSFTGIIPKAIVKLNQLELLDLGYNNFIGPLPPDLYSNLSLATILLDNNELLGGLASEIHHLKIHSKLQVKKLKLSNPAGGLSCTKKSTARIAAKEHEVQKRQLQGAGATLQMQSPLTNTPHLKVDSFAHPPPDSPDVYTPPSQPTNSPVLNVSIPPSQQNAAPPPVNQNTTSPAVNNSTTPSISPPNLSPAIGSHSSETDTVIIVGGVAGGFFLLTSIIGIFLCATNKAAIKPWASGLSGQLQKAFVTGVPKLKRSELEAGCEGFSNVIGSSPMGTLYKGTLSSGAEIVVASIAVSSAKDWSENLEVQFRRKVETLSKVNHKNFVNLLGYCEEDEPFSRMMVFEYAPNGTLFEHLHIKESEHLDWQMRLRIAMGMAYCLEYMHQLKPRVVHNNLNSSSVYLTEDYAAKISDFSFSSEIVPTDIEASRENLVKTLLPHGESNVYSFGVLLLEIVTGRLPYSVYSDSLEDWASDYLRGGQPLKEMVDPTLISFEEEKLESIGEVIRSCVHSDPQQRPATREVTARLRDISGITHDAAIPRLSPLWWAELEIMSPDAS